MVLSFSTGGGACGLHTLDGIQDANTEGLSGRFWASSLLPMDLGLLEGGGSPGACVS